MKNQKDRERLFLEEVTSIFPYFAGETITDSEHPDFLISICDKVIGVELVDYVRGQDKGDSPYRRNEILWQRVADVARAVFESQHREPLMVHFLWHSHRHLRKSEVDAMANEAASVIENHIPVKLFDVIQIDHEQIGNRELAHYARSIRITRTREKEQVLWSFINAGFISVPANELQSLIESKDVKVTEYLRKCDEIWLLIVADGSQISSNAELHQDVIDHDYSSDFTNILFYDRLSKNVFQLKVHTKHDENWL